MAIGSILSPAKPQSGGVTTLLDQNGDFHNRRRLKSKRRFTWPLVPFYLWPSPKAAALGLLCELAAGMRQRKSLLEFRKDMPFTDKHKAWQQLRRGRYVEFTNSIWCMIEEQHSVLKLEVGLKAFLSLLYSILVRPNRFGIRGGICVSCDYGPPYMALRRLGFYYKADDDGGLGLSV
ncbi:putative coproporphyrinogen oxidase [Helianthus annuus]|uniref:Coproporphyrinogen oxidase n=1 Tax=Helianthus annuus TaxID=4232 RepID=A0A9K3JG76_HELAN|nr:putative coproporphyrinogen oxidase [Helianthus annuus]KAJ0593111.1 putative coproporphyrinogen oxidase [Helianthus annuus]KAJ0600903.1 putative coproporphyrinogen oxidase [Helianthus annuus]KAJ0608121.1 putative coproporphyrinogen oxidase [Helianthus annuus]KAJ0768189.1 putative coproporphyrinogen oxidase [Helianthus annuus]